MSTDDIYTAAEQGDEAEVRRFVHQDPGLATAKGGPLGWDALTYLCFSPQLREDRSRTDAFVATARALLDAGAPANTGWFETSHHPDPVFESAIYGAAGVAKNAALTRLLLERGADPNDDETPYHAPETYENSAVQALVESGKLTSASLAVLLARKADWHDYEGIKYLLDHGADPNHVTIWGRRTPLQHSILRDNALGIVKLLLDRGGDPRMTSDTGSAARIAAHRGRGDVLAELLYRGTPLDLAPADRLAAACAMDDVETIARIKAEQPSAVEAMLRDGGEVLSAFAGNGNVAGVAHLLDLGVGVMARSTRGDGYWGLNDGVTALHVASWRAHHAVVRLLIQRGAEVNARDSKGVTPLQLAIKACVDSYWTHRRSPESVAALLHAGADTNGITVPTGYGEVDRLLQPSPPGL